MFGQGGGGGGLTEDMALPCLQEAGRNSPGRICVYLKQALQGVSTKSCKVG